MSIYNDFLDRRMELEAGTAAGVSASSVSSGLGPLSSLAGTTAINGAQINNSPNVSSPEAAALQNFPAGIAASLQVQAVADATIESTLTSQSAIAAGQSLASILIPTAQPEDIAASTAASSSTLQVNLQIMPEGFGSYLQDILPNDIATTAGAFSATMQQIKNIRNIPIEKFAQVAATLETTRGLPLVNGTNVPTDVAEAQAALALIALGSGPYGTYTFSDFFGCMSGLPYPWVQIQPAIIALQSSTLTNIYQQLYLAATWKQATGTVTPAYTTSAVETPPLSGNYNYYYQITAITDAAFGNVGGGYGRDGASAPTATIDGGSGATVNIIIDTNPANVATTYGRVTSGLLSSTGSSVNYGSGSSPTPPSPPTTLAVTIQAPPTTYGGSGWPAMNTAVQHYIDAANAEIAIIRTTHPGQSLELNDMWDNLGTQLGIEQKARNLGLSIVPDPREGDLFPYPTMVYSFTDLVPNYAKLTQPNMSVQTLEAISDLDKNAGQSIVAMMRSERNKARLLEAGITTDDTIADVLPAEQEVALIANGTVANSAPAFPFNTEPAGYFDPATENFVLVPTNAVLGAPVSTVASVLGIGTPDGIPIIPNNIGIGSPGLVGGAPLTGPGAGGGLGGQGGGPIVPGSLAGSPYTKLIPPALNPIYTSGSLLPASFPVQAAIEEVIRCNCDCWI